MSNVALEMHMPRTGDASVLVARQVVLAPPGPGEARVRIEAAGVAFADIVMRRGFYPGVKAPVTPGYDFVGRIEALGAGVEGWEIGARVAAVTVTGGYADRRNVEAKWLVAAPEGVAAEKLVAASLNGLTAWQMFHRLGGAQAGEFVLVHGAGGGVGAILLDLARLAGVTAIGTASPGKHSFVATKGAIPLDYRSSGIVDQVLALSCGGVVAAFDHIGGKHLKTVSAASLRAGGNALLYGGYDATRDGRLNLGAMLDLALFGGVSSLGLFTRSIGVIGYNVTLWRDSRPSLYAQDLAAVFQAVAGGQIDPPIGAVFSLEDAAEAQRTLESRAVTGKVVLKPRT